MITKRLAKAILLSPKEGTVIDLDEISWRTRPSLVGEKVDLFVNDVHVETCDLSFVREYANS